MNSRELVLVLGMVTVLVVCREKDSQVFPLVASRILGNSLVNDLCCLVTCVVWHVFHVGMMEMEECGSTFNRDCLPVSSKPCIVDSRG